MRSVISFNEDWKYHADQPILYPQPGHVRLYTEAKTECQKAGPASKAFDEGLTWEDVQLPHDYIIKQTPSQHNRWESGYFDYHNAWYRKHFTLDAKQTDKRIALVFEGVATHAEVYVNGCLAGRNHCGYTPFELDITSFVLFGEENVVAVYVDSSSSFEGWWYQGGGIYRDVWLVIGHQTHIARNGVFIHPEYKGHECWLVPVDVELRNDDVYNRTLQVVCECFSADGASIFKIESPLEMPAYYTQSIQLHARVEHPQRWDVDSPVLYTLQTQLYCEGILIDSQVDRFGFRTFHFDAQEGFFLNDRKLIIKGMNGHQDYGLTGKVMPVQIARYRAELLKEMGVNAVRCSHYPHTRSLMDSYDEMGFIVMAETRWFSDEPESIRQLEELIRLERNRPSVMLWSAGNEEPTHAEERGARIAKRLFARIRQLDPTRPVTTVVDKDPVNAPVNQYCDVICVNYNTALYDELHKKYPHKPFVAGELCATATTRGWYADTMLKRGFYSAYDHDSTPDYFLSRESTWKHLMARPWVSGGFQWDAFEHRGECRWPRLCSVSGAIDLFLQKKDAFYQNQSHWLASPMLHLMPHWNHTGKEGSLIPVWVYTNCEEVELFLNEKSLGIRRLNRFDHAEWEVPYITGQLRAIGSINHQVVCEDSYETTGPATALKLIVDVASENANGQDVIALTCVCLDANGRQVPDAEPLIHFDVNKHGLILGTGSAINDHSPVPCPDRKMYAGRCAVCIRVGKETGTLSIAARSAGLASAVADFNLK